MTCFSPWDGIKGERCCSPGINEPSLRGSLTRDEKKYPVPLYSLPRDLVRVDLSRFSPKYKKDPILTARVTPDNQVVPYLTRAEINGRGDFYLLAPPVAWVSSLTDRFFLEIQGSGRVELENGDLLQVHYDGKNGHPYQSIGKYLIEQGEIPREEMSMQAIRTWLETHPHRRAEVFHYNSSFVFFPDGKGRPFWQHWRAVDTPSIHCNGFVCVPPGGTLLCGDTHAPTGYPGNRTGNLEQGFWLCVEPGYRRCH